MNWLRPLALFLLFLPGSVMAEEKSVAHVVLGMHGGTGRPRQELAANPALEKEIRAALEQALQTGYAELQKPGATSLDAVEKSVRVLEDSPLFNAGKGAVFTHDGRNELDASIMEGKTRRAGAVAGVTVVKNPISAARAVMEKSKHVMLIGPGAEKFSKEVGLEIVDPKYFWTPERWQEHLDELKQSTKVGQGQARPELPPQHNLGTVGAVALDRDGNLAAATSTGGMSDKRFGRVGDSPIIGAGTYADNSACAVSCTGHGEYFIRLAVSHSIVSLMKYKDLPVEKAAHDVVHKDLGPAGGTGGVIALDPKGNFAMSYNSEGLYRGYVTKDGKVTVLLYEK
jgi:beta-aspartyl-peptidase (threonine type)